MAEYIFKRVNVKVNAVDSGIAFKEIRAGLFNYKKHDEDLENVFGCVLYREEESINNYNSMEFYLNDYIHNNILKYFGINIDSYLSLTRPERMKLNKVAKDKMIEEQKLLDELNKNKNVKTNNNIMFDDMGLS